MKLEGRRAVGHLPFALVVNVRDMQLGDAEAIGHIHTASWQAAYRGMISDAHPDGIVGATSDNQRGRIGLWVSVGLELGLAGRGGEDSGIIGRAVAFNLDVHVRSDEV